MTCRWHVRAALTEERSKAEIPLGFAVSRRDQVLLHWAMKWVQRFSICGAIAGSIRAMPETEIPPVSKQVRF